jgi:hypothetical protein
MNSFPDRCQSFEHYLSKTKSCAEESQKSNFNISFDKDLDQVRYDQNMKNF